MVYKENKGQFVKKADEEISKLKLLLKKPLNFSKEVIVGTGTKAFLRLYPTLFSTLPFSLPEAGLQNSAWKR